MKIRQCRVCSGSFETPYPRSRQVYCSDFCKRLWADYRLTLTEYQLMVINQNGVCAICQAPPGSGETNSRPDEKPRLAIDHDHKTKRVRGLLCGLCNRALGRADAVPDWLSKAKAYLERSAA